MMEPNNAINMNFNDYRKSGSFLVECIFMAGDVAESVFINKTSNNTKASLKTTKLTSRNAKLAYNGS